MKLLAAAALAACLLLAMPSAARAQTSQSLPRVVDLKTPDGTVLKGTYFAAAKPGPGVLLFHQSNRTRESWKDAAQQLAAAGINTLTVDVRGFGDSGGNWKEARKQWWASDIDTAFQYLVSQPGVTRDSIGIGGAGALGVDYSVETARLHSAEVKSLVLLSGETLRPQLQFLHDSPGLPELFVVSDDDEYPPTQAAMQLLYASASSPSKKLVHYVEPEEAPWLWYEPFDIGKVPAKGGHGTDLFAGHPELSGIILHWFVTTLLKTPGHAPADAVAAAPILEELEFGGGVAHATQQLMEARQKDTQVQLWPEVAVDIIGEDYQRAGNIKMAIDIFKLNVLAYPNSADANDNLAGAFLADGQKDLARQYAEKALALLDSHTLPASSWSDTEPRRGEIRRDLQQTLKKLSTGQ
jgi:dienelactone hydrolase